MFSVYPLRAGGGGGGIPVSDPFRASGPSPGGGGGGGGEGGYPPYHVREGYPCPVHQVALPVLS